MESTGRWRTVIRISCTQPTERDRLNTGSGSTGNRYMHRVQLDTFPYLPAVVYLSPLDCHIPNDEASSTVFLNEKTSLHAQVLEFKKILKNDIFACVQYLLAI